jgi:hypothetical protein
MREDLRATMIFRQTQQALLNAFLITMLGIGAATLDSLVTKMGRRVNLLAIERKAVLITM